MSQKTSWWRSAVTQRFAATLSIAVFGFVAMLAATNPVNVKNLKTQTTGANTPPQYGYSFTPHGVNLGSFTAPASFSQTLTFERYDKTNLGSDNVRFSLLENSTSPSWCTINPAIATVTETSTHTLTVNCSMGDAQAGNHSLLVISTSGSNEAQGLWATNSTSIEFSVQSNTPPTAPSNLSGEYIPNGAYGASVNLMWSDNSTTETSFMLYRRTPGGTWVLERTYESGTVSVQVAAPATTGSYEYYVTSCNNSNCSGTSNVVTVAMGSAASTSATNGTSGTTATSGGGGGDTSCKWKSDNTTCVADGVWAYTLLYGTDASGKGKWCKASGSAWECQATDPASGTATTTTPATTATTTTSTTTPSTSSSNGSYGSCNNYQENGLECSKCTDSSGQVTSTSCWQNSTATGAGSNPASTCTYSWGENDLICNTCKDSTGKVSNKNCWQENDSNYMGSDSNYVSNETMADRGATCKYTEQKVNGQNYSNWCEVCTARNGDILRDTCSNPVTAPYDRNTGTTDNEGCSWRDDNNGCMHTGDWGWNNNQWCVLWEDGDWECEGDWGNDDDDDDDRGNDDGGDWCEYYQDGDQSCKTCYNSEGEVTDEFCGDGGKTGGWCEWQDRGDGQGCNVCFDENGNQTEETCEDNGGNNTVDPQEKSRQLNDMSENVRWREHDLKEFSRFDKRIKRKAKEFGKKIENIERDMEWMERDGMDVSGLESIIQKVNAAVEDLEAIQPGIETERKAFETEVKREQTLLNQLEKNEEATWEHMDAMWMLLRRGDLYQVKRDIYDGRLNFYDMLDNYYEWLKEKEKLLAEIDRDNIKLTDGQKADFKEGDQWFGELEDLHEEFLKAATNAASELQKAPAFTEIEDLLDWEVRDEVREFYDFDLQDIWNDLRWARDGLNAHGWDNQLLWESLDEVRRGLEAKRNSQWITEEVLMIREELNTFERAINALKGKLDASSEKKLKDLENVIPKAYAILSDMEKFVQNTDEPEFMHEELESFWDDLRRLEDYVDPRVEDIARYVESRWDTLGLNQAEREAVEMMIDASRGDDGGECYKCDRLYDVYTEDIANQIKERITNEIIDEVVMQVKASVMEQVVKYVEEEVSVRVYEAILNNLDKLKGEKFGNNFGNDLLENGNKVTEQLTTVELDTAESRANYENEFDRLDELKRAFGQLPMPNLDVANRIAAFWESVQAALDRTPTKAELENLIKEGEALYAEAEETKYVYHLGFKDVPYIFDDNYDSVACWYCDYVVDGALDGRWEGYKNAEGELTYNFGPSDTTLRAEALKMVLAAFGYNESGNGDNWWDGWANRGRDLGATLVNQDLTQPVSRGEVMRLIYEVGRFEEPSDFQGYFPDVTIQDDWKTAEAMFDAGIFTGDGLTRNARLYDTLNRAESAAVINRAAQWDVDNEFVNEGLTQRIAAPSKAASASVRTTTKSVTLRTVLKALLPFF